MGLFVLSEPMIENTSESLRQTLTEIFDNFNLVFKQEEKLTSCMAASSISVSVSEVLDAIFILRPTISVTTKRNS